MAFSRLDGISLPCLFSTLSYCRSTEIHAGTLNLKETCTNFQRTKGMLIDSIQTCGIKTAREMGAVEDRSFYVSRKFFET